MKRIWNRIVEWYDWRIYWLAWKSINRMCHRDVGMAYLLQLFIAGWLESEGITPRHKHATEVFYKSLIEHTEPAALADKGE